MKLLSFFRQVIAQNGDVLAWLPCDKRGHFVVGAVCALIALPFLGLWAPVPVMLAETWRGYGQWRAGDRREAVLDWMATLVGAFVPVLATI